MKQVGGGSKVGWSPWYLQASWRAARSAASGRETDWRGWWSCRWTSWCRAAAASRSRRSPAGSGQGRRYSSAGSVPDARSSALDPGTDARTHDKFTSNTISKENFSEGALIPSSMYYPPSILTLWNSPCPRNREGVTSPGRSAAPTWPARYWWTGRWCTGRCWRSLRTALPISQES